MENTSFATGTDNSNGPFETSSPTVVGTKELRARNQGQGANFRHRILTVLKYGGANRRRRGEFRNYMFPRSYSKVRRIGDETRRGFSNVERHVSVMRLTNDYGDYSASFGETKRYSAEQYKQVRS